MKHKSLLLVSGLILLLVAAACGGSATAEPATQPAAASSEPTALPTINTAPGSAMVATTREGNLGTHLVDGDRMTLYLYTGDARNVSNCTGGCASAWPPLTGAVIPSAGEEVTAGSLGAITRDDGSSQAVYNGWPLYYYSGDQTPGDANGQDSRWVWFAVSTSGGPIQTNPAVNSAVHPELGAILVEASGRTLYLRTSDEPQVSNCSGGCALAWPPLVAVDDPAAGDGVDGDLLDTISREDGSVQVTYNGRPVYYYALDEKPGDTNGQGVGDVWFTASTAGEARTLENVAADDDY